CGVGAEVAAILAEQAFDQLCAPVLRIPSPDVPAPSSYPLELAFSPQADAIAAAAAILMSGSGRQRHLAVVGHG
ncbi:MAG: hypothetical protein OEY15_15910, partial [Myxococcales bacterium]|nr:hypothetical protein [Myxococcales bacterium]